MEKASLTMIEPALEPMFEIWVHGSEIQWARAAWAALDAAGLTSFRSESEKVLVGIRLMELATMYLDFVVQRWDTHEYPDVWEWCDCFNVNVDDVNNVVSPELSAEQIAELDCYGDYENWWWHFQKEFRPPIFQALCNAFGGVDGLYKSLEETRCGSDLLHGGPNGGISKPYGDEQPQAPLQERAMMFVRDGLFNWQRYLPRE